MLEPAHGLLDDERFWRYQSRGLALFITADSTRIYRLPLSFEPLVLIPDRFLNLKPATAAFL